MSDPSNFMCIPCKYVVDFRAISFVTFDQICYYRLASNIECLKAKGSIRKYVYCPELRYHVLLLRNNTLLIANHSFDGLSIKYQALTCHMTILTPRLPVLSVRVNERMCTITNLKNTLCLDMNLKRFDSLNLR
ncbi:hypothetical protein RF11_11883 [Thelohanellus kitauei]|uniref:Uncharacterized protein n=1 Tax=Thelohanellus kitauei TaxID=669202 RepID=A0A0C2I6E7_THEKT|nr:hypothetical protein RF11_11883 [Thelohanellus kitauei]